MEEGRRGTVSCTLTQRRLGMYLEAPEGSGERGAVLVRFELVDGAMGEVEQTGIVRPGCIISHVNDTYLQTSPFSVIITALVHAARPVKITFKDPDVLEFRDRYGFLRSKLANEKETAYFTSAADALKRNDMEWLGFFSELGGKRGQSFGVLRLMRDCCGEIVFPLEPATRLNAMSPIHGRMDGISSSNSSSSGSGARASAVSGTVAEVVHAPPPQAVIDIYKRCWTAKPGNIGIPQPPGLVVDLPGETAKGKALEKAQDTLRRLVLYGGIPAAYRPAVWYEISGSHAKAALHPPGYYTALTLMKPSPEAAYAIQKDIDRTFPGHAYFESEAGLASLRRVLMAFAVNNPDIGYAQSLNFVAGFLLLLMPEEHAFWMLETIVTELLPPHYYDSALMGVHIDQRVLAHLVWETMPDVSDILGKAGIQLHVVTLEWFMCAFATVLPTHTAVRVWDAFFLCGAEVFFRVALALIFAHRTRIRSIAASSTQSNIVVKTTAGSGFNGGAGVVVESTQADVSGVRRSVTTRDTVAETAKRVMAAATSPPPPSGLLSPAILPPSATSTASGAGGSGTSGKFTITTPRGTVTTGSVSGVRDDSVSPSPIKSNDAKLTSGTGRGGDGEATGSDVGGGGFSPVIRGGTMRHPSSTFPALYAMFKSLPSTATDPDELLKLAFPPTKRDAKSTIPWENHVNPARLAKLRTAAKAVVQGEYEESQAMRAATCRSRSSESDSSGPAIAGAIAAASSGAGTGTAVGSATTRGVASGSVSPTPLRSPNRTHAGTDSPILSAAVTTPVEAGGVPSRKETTGSDSSAVASHPPSTHRTLSVSTPLASDVIGEDLEGDHEDIKHRRV